MFKATVVSPSISLKEFVVSTGHLPPKAWTGETSPRAWQEAQQRSLIDCVLPWATSLCM